MSDFGFENNFNQGNFGEEDPAAEFLAREQDELAGLEDENFVSGTNHVGGGVENGEFEDLGAVDEVGVGWQNDDDIYGNENDFHPDSMHMNGMDEAEQLPPVKPVVKEEPEKIKKWREEHKLRLEQKDIEEEKKKDELRASAKHELEEWYRHHLEQVEKTQLQNRNAEKEHVMERDAQVAGQEWERIARLCDFNPKTSKTTKDVSRMRSIILQLKQNPPSAAKH